MKKILYSTCLFLWLACGDTPSRFNPTVEISEVTLSENQNYRIGVIGSGIGGASFVHFINQAAAKNCQITVYEKENRIGGRVKKDILGGGMIEQGATLIHSSNYYLQDIMNT